MTQLEPVEYLAHLADESRRFATVLADCDPRSIVPTCPAWRADDLLWHLTGVQHFWNHVISLRPEPPKAYLEAIRPDSFETMLEEFAECSAALVESLAQADPAAEAWSWATEQTVGFTLRRQAHEAMVHRVDAEQTVGTLSPLPTALAADAVHEMLSVFVAGCPPWADFSPLPHYVRLDCSDTAQSVWVQLGTFSGVDPDDEVRYDNDDLDVVPDPGVQPDAVISGTAEALALRLWRRGDNSGLKECGDRSMADRFWQIVSSPIN